jgi:hypothetical protein
MRPSGCAGAVADLPLFAWGQKVQNVEVIVSQSIEIGDRWVIVYDHFNIKRNRDILGHDTPRFKITLRDLATICLY